MVEKGVAIFAVALADADAFSSHSLRRGFAQWAGMSGWDLRELMNYVGWRDVKAAMRYLDGVSTDQKARFEQGLDRVLPEKQPVLPPQLPSLPKVALTTIEVSIDLSAFNGGRRGVANALRDMASTCLARFQAQPLEQDGRRYQIWQALGLMLHDPASRDRISPLES